MILSLRSGLNLSVFLAVGLISSSVMGQEFYSSVPLGGGGSGSSSGASSSSSSGSGPTTTTTTTRASSPASPFANPANAANALNTSNTTLPSGGAPGFGLGRYARSPLRYSVAVREGYDSNVFQTNTDPISSFYTNIGGGLTYSFGSPRLQLTTALNGGVTYYYSRPGDKMDYTGSFVLSAIYKATSRLLLGFSTQTAYISQPDLDIAGTDAQQNGDYFFSSTTMSGTYQWTRKFSTVTTYNVNAYYYVDSGLNDTQGRIEQTIGQQFRWLLLPKTNIVAEYRINPINFFEADQNSLGQFFLLGFDQIFNPRATWTVRAGLEQRWLNNATDGQSTYLGPYGESLLSYQFGPQSYVTWNMRYGTEASGLSGVTQRQTFRTGLTVTHSFTSRIGANFGLTYMNNYYSQSGVIPDYYENVFAAVVGVSYRINRVWSLDAGYQFTVDSSQEEDQSYQRSVAFVGTSVSF